MITLANEKNVYAGLIITINSQLSTINFQLSIINYQLSTIMKRIIIIATLLATISSLSAQQYVGGDISLLPSYEDNGSKYLDQNGNTIADLITFSAENGLNTMRVRLFVEPANASSAHKGEGVRQDMQYVIPLAKRIKAAGLNFMLDFHYSDTWADPAKQWTPKAWLALSDDQLSQQIYDYTRDCLQQLVDAEATPDLIQTGNEISYGMLWGAEGTSANHCYSGNSANWPRFTTLLKQAGKACREVCPSAKIILHTERVANTGVLTNFYRQMQNANVDYDIIGTSYYPYYHGSLSTLSNALTILKRDFPDKPVLLVETGYFYAWQPKISSPGVDLSATYPISPEGQKAFTTALISTLQQHDNAVGLIWWMMEANEYGHTGSQQTTTGWYNASLFDDQTGRVNPAFFELQTFIRQDDAIRSAESDGLKPENRAAKTYDLLGRIASPRQKNRIVISENRKTFNLKP